MTNRFNNEKTTGIPFPFDIKPSYNLWPRNVTQEPKPIFIFLPEFLVSFPYLPVSTMSLTRDTGLDTWRGPLFRVGIGTSVETSSVSSGSGELPRIWRLSGERSRSLGGASVRSEPGRRHPIRGPKSRVGVPYTGDGGSSRHYSRVG